MGNSFFHFRHFSITSQEKGLKVTTDACLLGALAFHSNPKFCLDIGTGCGVLALFLSDRFLDSKVDAIEIDENVCSQARVNIENSPFYGRIHLIHGDFLQVELSRKYDLIVCNPPYFSAHLQKAESEKNRAIHNSDLNTKELLKKAELLMNPNGRFYLIYPWYEAEQLKLQLGTVLEITEEIQIFNAPGKHFRTIICLEKKKNSETIRKELLLHDENGKVSEAFRLLMSPFYLENTEKYRHKRG